MSFFGTFIARKVGYMRSSLSNRDLNRLIIDKLNQLDKDEQNMVTALHHRVHHSLAHQSHLQLNTLETIEFYLKVKIVRLLEENKRVIQELHNEMQQLQQEKRKLAKEGKYAMKDTDADDVKQLKYVLVQKENDAITRKMNGIKETIKKCDEFRQTLIGSTNKNIQDNNVIRSNA